jgi:hypothetical protein
MRQREMKMRCPNCGTEFTPAGPLEFNSQHDAWGYDCPVCQYHVPPSALTEQVPSMTLGEFETELRALLARARTGGLSDEELVPVLRDELEFVAELAHPGRRVSAQIIDLGSQFTEITGAALPDRRDALRTRAIGS